jgi:hypothetical protein
LPFSQELLQRIDVDRIQPLAKELAEMGEAIPRIEATLGRLVPS